MQTMMDKSDTGSQFVNHKPDFLIFEVTQRCNHDCLHCYNCWKNDGSYSTGELSTRETLSLLGKVLDETSAKEVTLTGGEPFLRDDLFEIVDFLNDRRVSVDVISNGSLLDEEVVGSIGPGRITAFELPLLSSDAAVHDRLSGAEGAFDKVTEAIADLKLHQHPVVCVFVATRLNLHTWAETAEMAFALGADAVMFNRFNPGGTGFKNLELLQPSPEELIDALDTAEALTRDISLPISCSIAMPPCLFDHERWPNLSFGFCGAGTKEAYYTIDPVGKLRPCNHSMLILGDLREKSFAELTSSRTMADFMAARPAFCAGCRMEDLCLGGCKAAAEVCYGDYRECDPFLRKYGMESLKLR